MSAAKSLAGFAAGIVFALGLGIAEMTRPAKIKGFLDIAGDWDPSLLFVMAGAVGVSFIVFRLTRGHAKPVLAANFLETSRTAIDRSLIGGAALFGAGWGLSGFCPGPAITALATGLPQVVVFVLAMGVGMIGYRLATQGSRAVSAGAGQPATAGAAAVVEDTCG
jgi:hypothetical protein